jgi:hypothetical protein
MYFLSWIVSGVCGIGAAFIWIMAIGLILRRFGVSGIRLPAKINFFRPLEALDAALKGSSPEKYILISGFLAFACPLLVCFTVYDYISNRYVWHSTYSLHSFVGSAVIFTILGVVVGLHNKRAAEN